MLTHLSPQSLFAVVLLFAACGPGAGAEDAGTDADDGATPDSEADASDTGVTVDVGPTTACPSAISIEIDPDLTRLDIGYTGIAHEMGVPGDNVVTLAVESCESATPPCGVCQLRGPIRNQLKADNHRCASAPHLVCREDSECPASDCRFYFGAPVPLGAGGVPACTVAQMTGEIVGTLDVEGGSLSLDTVPLSVAVHSGEDLVTPCPICEADPTPFDDTLVGTCRGGARDGQPCDVAARGRFGETSFDCPPSIGRRLTTMALDLGPVRTEAVSKQIVVDQIPCGLSGATPTSCLVGECDGSNEACFGDGDCDGVACVTPRGSARPNVCRSGMCTPRPDDNLLGYCDGDPPLGSCANVPLAACLTDLDCDVLGVDAGECVFADPSCFLDPLVAEGLPGTLRGTQLTARAGSIFAVRATSNGGMNSVAGLPGPGRFRSTLVIDYLYGPVRQ